MKAKENETMSKNTPKATQRGAGGKKADSAVSAKEAPKTDQVAKEPLYANDILDGGHI